jgi:hypothetical protein
MRIHHTSRYRQSALVVAVMLCCGVLAGYAGASDVPAVKRKPVSRSAAKASSGRSSRKVPAKAGSRKTAQNKRGRIHSQNAPTSDRISEIQSALATQGAYHGEVNGKWDDSTISAMKQFQSSHGLNPSGRLDALSLQKLGLGSDVAGRGAPLPASNPQASVLQGSTPERP